MSITRRNGFALMLGAAVTALALGACAPAVHGNGPGRIRNERTILVVENDNINELAVYAVRSGMRARIGTARAATSTRFVLPESMLGSGWIQLLLDPIGSREQYLSDEIPVSPGQQVRFRVAQRMQMSTFTVY